MTCEVGFVLAGLGIGNTIEYQHKLIRLLRVGRGLSLQLGRLIFNVINVFIPYQNSNYITARAIIERENDLSLYPKTKEIDPHPDLSIGRQTKQCLNQANID